MIIIIIIILFFIFIFCLLAEEIAIIQQVSQASYFWAM